MALPTLLHLAIMTVMTSDVVFSVVTYNDGFLYKKLGDASEALNYLHQTLTDQMPLDEKCIRYAVLSSFLSAKGPPRIKDMCKYFDLNDEQLKEIYQQLEANDELPPLYMQAIDGFRSASRISPPFLELIECLKKFDKPYIDLYLNNPELVVIADLHKQIVQSPDMKIDLVQIEQPHLSRAFMSSLRYIFTDNLLDTSQSRDLGPRTRTQEADLRRLNVEGMVEEQLLRRHPKGRRDPRRMVTSYRHREQERLRKQRLKLIQPDVERIKAQERQRKLRKRQRTEDQKQPYLVPVRPRLPATIFQQGPEDQSKIGRLMPDLAQLWSQTKPVYESIATPVQSDSSVGQIVPIETKSKRPQPFVRPLTQYPCSLRDTIHSAPPLKSSERGPQNQSRVYNYLTDSEEKNLQSRFDIPALHIKDRFDDIESVLQMFRNVSRAKEERQTLDSNGENDVQR